MRDDSPAAWTCLVEREALRMVLSGLFRNTWRGIERAPWWRATDYVLKHTTKG